MNDILDRFVVVEGNDELELRQADYAGQLYPFVSDKYNGPTSTESILKTIRAKERYGLGPSSIWDTMPERVRGVIVGIAPEIPYIGVKRFSSPYEFASIRLSYSDGSCEFDALGRFYFHDEDWKAHWNINIATLSVSKMMENEQWN